MCMYYKHITRNENILPISKKKQRVSQMSFAFLGDGEKIRFSNLKYALINTYTRKTYFSTVVSGDDDEISPTAILVFEII